MNYYLRINYFDVSKVELMLQKYEIDFFLKNVFESSIMAGWASPGASFNEQYLFVEYCKLDLSKKLLDKYLIK